MVFFKRARLLLAAGCFCLQAQAMDGEPAYNLTRPSAPLCEKTDNYSNEVAFWHPQPALSYPALAYQPLSPYLPPPEINPYMSTSFPLNQLSNTDLLNHINMLNRQNSQLLNRLVAIAEESDAKFRKVAQLLEATNTRLERIEAEHIQNLKRPEAAPDNLIKALQGLSNKHPYLNTPIWIAEKLLQTTSALSAAFVVYSSTSWFIAILPVAYAPTPALPFFLAISVGGVIYGLSRGS